LDANVGFLSGPHQGTKAKAATKKQVHSGPKQAESKQTQKAKEKADARKNVRNQQAGKPRSKRTQATTARTQAQTDAKWQGKNGRKQQASGCNRAKTYASGKRVHSGPNIRKTTRKNHTQASNKRVHSGTNGCKQQAGALKPKWTQNDKAKTHASSKRVQNGRKQQLRGAHRARAHTSQGAGEEPNPHLIGVKGKNPTKRTDEGGGWMQCWFFERAPLIREAPGTKRLCECEFTMCSSPCLQMNDLVNIASP
jgi:hypothetical protein